MTPATYRPLVHRTAFATMLTALLPIAVGALVTSMNAGMAFRDWPNSDGQFMLTYPWLADFVRGTMDKFVEHGHRLAGMLIGFTSILLVAVVWKCESRRWVRGMAAAVLGCVIVQGLLGGGRVLANDPRMAMVHGNFAAIVFCLMGTLTLVTSRRWMSESKSETNNDLRMLKVIAGLTTLTIYLQFVLGGRQRHLHDMLYEHLGTAALVMIAVLATFMTVQRSGIDWLKSAGRWMLFLFVVQAGLGIGSWITKFGLASTGYVAVQGSPMQLAIRSSHTVVGMLLLMTSVILLLRVFRATDSSCRETGIVPVITNRMTAEGGAG